MKSLSDRVDRKKVALNAFGFGIPLGSFSLRRLILFCIVDICTLPVKHLIPIRADVWGWGTSSFEIQTVVVCIAKKCPNELIQSTTGIEKKTKC